MKTSETRPPRDWMARSLAVIALAGSIWSFFWPPMRWEVESPSSDLPASPSRSVTNDSTGSDPLTKAPQSAEVAAPNGLSSSVKLAGSPAWNQLSLHSRELFNRARKAVVRVEIANGSNSDNSFGPRGTSATQTQAIEAAQGSGLIFHTDGLIVTNYHVVRESTRVEIQLDDGRRLPAWVLAVDAAIDVAILKVEATGLPVIEWADSEQIRTGDFIWALGYPYGWRQSLSFGIVSAVPQSPSDSSPLASLLQSDVAIHPGHSGSCWLNSDGQVIGIATNIVGKTFQGLSYAIPSNVVQTALRNLQSERTGEN